MTDKDIIKGFKCCINRKCSDCPYREIQWDCDVMLEADVLTLINRQQSLLRKEENKNSKLRNERNRLNAEIELLKTNNHSLAITLSNRAKVERAEAIKEFAERLKKKGTPVTGGKGFEGVYVMCSNLAIDNIVKELTEVKDDEK